MGVVFRMNGIHYMYFHLSVVTEAEIENGMFNQSDPSRSCICFYRNITNLDQHLANKRTPKFIDLLPGTSVIDTDAQSLLTQLKSKKLLKVLTDGRSVENFMLEWESPDVSDPNDNSRYLTQFCRTFYEKMSRLIIRSLQTIEGLQKSFNMVEVLQHLSMCRLRSDVFRGREDILQRVQAYMTSEAGQPLVVYGESGSGKTSVVAKAASMSRKWLKGCNPCVIIRFLGEYDVLAIQYI